MARIQDPAEIGTDAIIAEIERRLKIEYAQAQREIAAKVEDYYRRYEIKLQTWQKWVTEGKKTKAEFQSWKVGQLAVGKRWEDLRDQLAKDLYNTNQIARSIARGYMPDVYALNHNYATFECEAGSGVDTSYTLYSREAVENIFRDNPQMLPDPGRRVSQEIAEGKAIRWNNRHIQSVMMQALLQGNNISDIATRLANAVGDSDRKAAIRNARTMATGTQNRARRDAYKRAKSKGIDLSVMWIATLDMRTRHSHRQLDHMVTDVDKPFVFDDEIMGHVSIMYPGQPKPGEDTKFPQEMIWNCRCTLRAVVKGLERRSGTSGDVDMSQIEGMSYEEWKASRIEKPKNILRPDQRSDEARAEYIREYRERGGYVPSGRDMTLTIDALTEGTQQAQERSKPFNSTKLKAAMGDDYEAFRQKVEDAPTKKLYEAFIEEPTIIQEPYSGIYRASLDQIEFDYSDYEGQDRYSGLAHECGHMFDFKLGRLDDLSYSEIDLINERCPVEQGARPLSDRPSNSDEFLRAVRSDLERLRSNLESGDLVTDLLVNPSTSNASAGIQDALDGAYGTLESDTLPWGHGDRYYDRMYYRMISNGNEESLLNALTDLGFNARSQDDARRLTRAYDTAREAWANVASAVTVGGAELSMWERYMPDTVAAFRRIIEGWSYNV